MFSPKVLDRANVIEFRVNGTEMESFFKTPKALDMNVLRGNGASMGESFVSDATRKGLIAKELGVELMPFFKRLQEAGAEFGYRTASEISRFVAICTELADDEMTRERARNNFLK
jgi:5-methylcytosine-specific restriction protein B